MSFVWSQSLCSANVPLLEGPFGLQVVESGAIADFADAPEIDGLDKAVADSVRTAKEMIGTSERILNSFPDRPIISPGNLPDKGI